MSLRTSTRVHAFDAEDPSSVDLTDLKRRLLEAQLDDRRPRSCGQQLRSMLTLEYFKQVAPSVVLAVVAILALTASAKAQAQINDVSSSLVATQAQLAVAQVQAQAAQTALLQVQGELDVLRLQTQQVRDDARAQLANATQQFQVNQALRDAAQLQLSTDYASALSVLQQVRAINASYPYPWLVAQEVAAVATQLQTLRLQLNDSTLRAELNESELSQQLNNIRQMADNATRIGGAADATALDAMTRLAQVNSSLQLQSAAVSHRADALRSDVNALQSLSAVASDPAIGPHRVLRMKLYCADSGAAPFLGTGSWVVSVLSGTSVGTCRVGFYAQLFATIPVCVCSGADGFDAARLCHIGSTTSTFVDLATWVNGAPSNMNVHVLCFGPNY